MSKKREILQRLHIKKGEYLIRQGDFGINGYVVQSGMLEVFITQDGQEIRLAVLGPGEVVGELALLHDGCRSASVRALSACNLVVMDRDTMRRKLADADPGIRALVKILSERVKRTNLHVAKTAQDKGK